jgi:PAS domain S-box-containing protein/putative nucleotidyltransferase with HDIG domain
MKHENAKKGISAHSVLLAGILLGIVYWTVDTLFYIFTSSELDLLTLLASVTSTKEIWQRMIVLCFLAIFGSHVHYTARKQREAEGVLLESEERYRELVENSTDAIVSVDEKMRIVQWNRAATGLFGFPKETIMGSPVDILIPEQYKPKYREGVQRFRESGDIAYAGVSAELEGLRKDGSTVPIEISLSANTYRGLRTITAIVRETTERRRALDALRESEEKYRNLFEESRDAVIIWTAEGKILGVNQAALEIFQCGIDHLIGADISDLYADQGAMESFHRNLDQEGGVRAYELRLKKSDGSVMDCLLTASVRRGKDGKVLGYQGIVRDVTRLKQNEMELKRTLDTLRRSIGGVTQAMSSIVERRDPYTAGHQRRVADLARMIAREMGLSQDQIDAVHLAGILHDIGKIAIPAEILTNPGKLNVNSFALIKDHPQTGYDILHEIEFPFRVADIILQHHEACNGTGYPHGLAGEKIMVEARILTVADVVEAMASHRPYRPSLGLERALEEIEEHRGTLYDKDVADACLRLFREKDYKIAD